MRAIFMKEWIKLKPAFALACILVVAALGTLWYRLYTLFLHVEPESMVWFRFSFLGNKPYFFLWMVFFALGVLFALAQFLPERLNGRVKILAHLPLAPVTLVVWHLGIGILMLGGFGLLIGLGVWQLFGHYYPAVALWVVGKDVLFYLLGSILVYTGTSGAILEKSSKRALVKLLICWLAAWVFFQPLYTIADLLWLIVVLFFGFLVLESFLRIKGQALKTPFFIATALVALLFWGVKTVDFFKQTLTTPLTHYYIFYSPLHEAFAYQRNYGGHQFEYGLETGKTFDRQTYEALLPFVYWRNLELQNKLPITINGLSYDAQTIKKSRLSFAYNPQDLHPKEIGLYPFLNPNPAVSMIPFPEEVLYFDKHKIIPYGEHARIETALAEEIAALTQDAHVAFPVSSVWGKHTNLKPHDFGLFFLDATEQFFTIKRYNNRVFLEKIALPEGITPLYMYPSENTENRLGGYVIDTQGGVHVLFTEGWKLQKLDLPDFDYTTMRFQLLQDPLHFLMRYDDGNTYHAVLFSHQFEKLKHTSFSAKAPKGNRP